MAHVHPLEPRRLLAAFPVADLSLSDIPDPAGAHRPGAVLNDVYYFPVQWQPGRPFFPPGLAPQLFRSDGTPGGAGSVKTFEFGRVLADFTAIDGFVYFTASEGTATQVWRTDGTPAGTVMVHEGSVGSLTENGVEFFAPVAGGDVYFNADGLWKVAPGAAAATRVSTDTPLVMGALDGRVYFLAQLGLWRTDGTAAGTVRVKALPQSYSARPTMADVGGVLYFRADGSGLLYRSDGTADGTFAVTGPPPQGSPAPPPYNVAELTPFRGQLFFTAFDSNDGAELWKSDGTAAGTVPVADAPGPRGSSPRDLTVVGDTLYFTADDGVNGRELWKTDGTAEGTALVADLAPGAASSNPRMLTAALGKLFFTYTDARFGQELFVSDGTTAGTRPAADVVPGPASPLAGQITAGGDRVFFTGVHPAAGYSAFAATAGGVTFGGDILAGPLNVRVIGPLAAATAGGDVYYADGDTTPTGREPHVVPAGGAPARPAADLEPGPGPSDPQQFHGAGDAVFFRAATTAGGMDLWRAGPETGSIALMKDLVPAGAQFPAVSVQGPFDGRWFVNVRYTPVGDPFAVERRELWVTQGTADTTAKLGDLNLPALVPWRDALYYLSDGGGTTANLVRMSLEGTTRQTVKTVPTNPPPTRAGVPARELRAVGDLLYFTALDRFTGAELWKSDGTANGTVMVKDLAPGAPHSSPKGFTQVRGNVAVFAASPNAPEGQPDDLWVTDGTAAGTAKLLDARPGMRGAAPRDFVHYRGAVYFTADDGAHGRELWKTDGTSAGTVLVKDVNPGAAGSAPSELRAVGGRLYFVASDPLAGRELWASDGTPGGTARVEDIRFGPGSSDPMNLTDVGGDLYFTANDGARPRLYRVPRPPAQVVGRYVFYNGSGFDNITPGADAADDDAVATDKAALLPGQSPTFANVTTYDKGINGVMVDVADLPEGAALTADDFDFGGAATPTSVTVRRGAGASGSDRVTLIWREFDRPDPAPTPKAVGNGWLTVTVKANAHTGLSSPDVFSFGNLIGEAGDAGATLGWRVNALDLAAVRRVLNTAAPITAPTDFNRDGRTNALDLALVKRNLAHALPAPPPPMATADRRSARVADEVLR